MYLEAYKIKRETGKKRGMEKWRGGEGKRKDKIRKRTGEAALQRARIAGIITMQESREMDKTPAEQQT